MRKYNWKQILTRGLWLLTGAGAIVLLGAAMQKKDQKKCIDVKIEITGVEKHMFIDEKDVMDMINVAGNVEGTRLSVLQLRSMEAMVEQNPWVKNAEMYIDNQQILQVKIEERQPVARVFTMEGTSFYVDSAAMRLPLSDKLSARVPVFTGFPSAKAELSKPDSVLLKDIVSLGRYILADSFWMAQTAQVNITSNAHFEMLPLVGDHIVELGNAGDIENKFKRLYAFYTKAWLQNGINTYEKLDVQYSNQVVAVRRGTAKALIDSARAKEIMEEMQLKQPVDSSIVQPVAAPIVKVVKDTAKAKPAVITKPVQTLPAKQKTVKPVNNKTTTNTLSNEKKSTGKEKEAKAVMKRP